MVGVRVATAITSRTGGRPHSRKSDNPQDDGSIRGGRGEDVQPAGRRGLKPFDVHHSLPMGRQNELRGRLGGCGHFLFVAVGGAHCHSFACSQGPWAPRDQHVSSRCRRSEPRPLVRACSTTAARRNDANTSVAGRGHHQLHGSGKEVWGCVASGRPRQRQLREDSGRGLEGEGAHRLCRPCLRCSRCRRGG